MNVLNVGYAKIVDYLHLKREINGLDYEFAARCTCIAGQRMSNRIKNIDNSLAEVFAMENYMSFNGNLE